MTRLHDGQSVRDGHAVLVFIKLAPAYRYGVFKSQNFQDTGTSFTIAKASAELRTVESVFDRDGKVANVVEVLAVIFLSALPKWASVWASSASASRSRTICLCARC
jgi:hypothetical protein